MIAGGVRARGSWRHVLVFVEARKLYRNKGCSGNWVCVSRATNVSPSHILKTLNGEFLFFFDKLEFKVLGFVVNLNMLTSDMCSLYYCETWSNSRIMITLDEEFWYFFDKPQWKFYGVRWFCLSILTSGIYSLYYSETWMQRQDFDNPEWIVFLFFFW